MATIRKNNNDTFYINELVYPRIFRAEIERGEVYLYNVYTGTVIEQNLGKLSDMTINGAAIGSDSQEVFLNKLRELIFNKGGGSGLGASGSMLKGEVDTYADLLKLSGMVEHDLWFVRKTTGIFLLGTRRIQGWYRYTGTAWETTNLPSEIITEKEHGALIHNNSVPYYTGNLIWHNGALQRCKTDIIAKAFTQTDWEPIKSNTLWEAINEDTTTAYIYKGGLNTNNQWQINRYDRANNLSRTKANLTNNSATASLTKAWANRANLTYA